MIDINDILEGNFGTKRYDCRPALYDQIIEELNGSSLDDETLDNILRFLDQSPADLVRRVLRSTREWDDHNAKRLVQKGIFHNFLDRMRRIA